MLKIAVFVDTARASGRKFLAGIKRFSVVSSNWQVYTPFPAFFRSRPRSKSFPNITDLDGIILRDMELPGRLTNLKIPIVINDTRCEHLPDVCTLDTACAEIAAMAVNHFFELGFKHFAFGGWADLPWSQKRYACFSGNLENAGIQNCAVYMETRALPDCKKISKWLRNLPRPVGIFACNDDFALQILECCRTDKIAVPEEVAILGVDNDELICDLARPSLSSIELNFETAGFEAARLLEDVILGKSQVHDIMIRPTRVISRQSTNMLAIEDAELRNAIIFIRGNYLRNIQVTEIASVANVSKRNLALKFKRHLKRTVKDELLRLRIENLKYKLLNTNETLSGIASGLQYTDPEHFCRFFKRAVGLTPARFRKKNKA